MKSRLIFFGLVFAFIGNKGFAFDPLIGSDWSREHPDLLPFSKCAIERVDNVKKDIRALIRPKMKQRFWSLKSKELWPSPKAAVSLAGGVGIGGSASLEESNKAYLTCVSLEHNLAYRIPIKLGNKLTVGQAGVSFMEYRIKFLSSSLHQKTVNDIFGTYGGINAGFTLSCGFSRGLFVNPKGISFIHKGSIDNGGILATCGPASLTLSRSNLQASPRDPFILTSTTLGQSYPHPPVMEYSQPMKRFQLKPEFFVRSKFVDSFLDGFGLGTVGQLRIYHTPQGSTIYRDLWDVLDYEAIGKLRFVYDGKKFNYDVEDAFESGPGYAQMN